MIEPTDKSYNRLSRKEAVTFIANSLRLSTNTVNKRTIYEAVECRTSIKPVFFDKAMLINWVNKKLG